MWLHKTHPHQSLCQTLCTHLGPGVVVCTSTSLDHIHLEPGLVVHTSTDPVAPAWNQGWWCTPVQTPWHPPGTRVGGAHQYRPHSTHLEPGLVVHTSTDPVAPTWKPAWNQGWRCAPVQTPWHPPGTRDGGVHQYRPRGTYLKPGMAVCTSTDPVAPTWNQGWRCAPVQTPWHPPGTRDGGVHQYRPRGP